MKRAIKQWTSPKHRNYNLIDERLDSFTNWPRGSPSPKSLSEAGFFFAGKYKSFFSFIISFQNFVFTYTQNFDFSGRGDDTISFCCGVGIHEWLPSDNAWQEHARWSPYCVFVRYIRGPAFFVRVDGWDLLKIQIR